MGRQIRVTIEDDMVKKLEQIQQNFKKEYGETLSFSNILNEILQYGLIKN